MQNLIIKNNKQKVELVVVSATAVSPQTPWLQLCGGLWMEQGLVPAIPAGPGEAGMWLWLFR